jgi:hypothetical protein
MLVSLVQYCLDEEYLEVLRSLRERIVRLREEKSLLLSKLDDLEAEAQEEADTLEQEITVLESKLEVKKKGQKHDIVFSF